MGAEFGCREKRDYTTYFGCKKRWFRNKGKVSNADIVNDIVLKLQDKIEAENYRGRHFEIKYNPSLSSYFIKDLKIGFGTFVKLIKPLTIKDGSIIMVGDSFLILNLLPDKAKGSKPSSFQSNILRLKVTVYADPSNGEILYIINIID